jgi:hypothetical protein
VPDWFINQHASLFSRMWEGIIGRKAENGEVTPSSNPEILDAIIALSKRSTKVKEALKRPSATMARQKVELERATNLARKYMLRYFTLTDHLAELLCEVLGAGAEDGRPVFYDEVRGKVLGVSKSWKHRGMGAMKEYVEAACASDNMLATNTNRDTVQSAFVKLSCLEEMYEIFGFAKKHIGLEKSTK